MEVEAFFFFFKWQNSYYKKINGLHIKLEGEDLEY